MSEISQMDREFYARAREHISAFRRKWTPLFSGLKVLEIGPETEVYEGADTLGLNDGCTYKGDLCQPLDSNYPYDRYDVIVCCEVIEHTVLPHVAIDNIRRLGRDGALCLFSAPWGFRKHHPNPDCWRISKHGWQVLLRNFDILEIDILGDPDRWLMPIHYTVLARINKVKDVPAHLVHFEDETI